MSVVLFDGFDHGDALSRWTAIGNTTNVTTPVRTGTHARRLSGSGGIYLALNAAEEDDVMYTGFGFNTDQGVDVNLVVCEYSENFGATSHLSLVRRTGIRGWEVRRGAGTSATAGTVVIPAIPNKWFPQTWHYVEFGAKIHDTTGWVEVRQDGIGIGRFDGDTRNGGVDALIDQVHFVQPGGAPNQYWIDDVYILNEQGSIPALTTWLGDTRMFPLYPIGDGFYLMLVGSDADSIDNWMLVDETGAPVTTDYVFSATIGDRDTYEFSDLPVTVGTVRGIEIRVHAAKNDTGTKTFRTIDRRAGADAFQADHVLAALPLWQTHHDILEQDPHAGPGDWTIPNVNATEWGVDVTL